jgi:hypothetical protein
MFFDNLRRIRPSSSVFLAAAAIAVGVACGGDSGPPDQLPPVGGPGGTTGGSPVTGTAGGGTTGGGTTGGGTTGGGTTGGGTTGGGTTGGGTTGGGTTGGGTTGGGTTGGGAWMAPNPSKVKGTAGMCLSTQAAAGGKCGSYYCNIAQATLMPEIDPSKPCGHDSAGATGMDVYDYACEASLATVVTMCATKHALDADAPAATKKCVKETPSVSSKKVGDTCIDCFVSAADCCKANATCLSTCLSVGVLTTQKQCDDEQKKAKCLDPLWSCAGLPSPF